MTMKVSSSSFCEKTATGSFMYQYMAMLTGTLSIICSGMHYGWPSPSLPKLDEEDIIPLTNEEGSWMAVMPLIGALCGSIIGALILDVVGRKKVALLSSFPFFAAWIMVAYAKSVLVLVIARFIAGISDGLAFCALPMYLGEIADPKIRGSLGSSVSVTWIFGTLLINIIGSYMTISTTALISSIVPILCLLTFSWMPESPYYLIMKGNIEQARRSLRIFKGTDDVEGELDRMTRAVKEQHANSGRCLDLFTVRSNRKALFIMMGVRGAQQFSGTTAITFYAHTIFKESGDTIPSSTAAIIYFSIQVALCACCSMIVDKTGRRPLLIISTIGAGLALLIEGAYFYISNSTNIDVSNLGWIPLAALIFFVIVFSIGMQTIPILLLGEIFPTNVKAFALCLADIYFSVIATIVSKFFQITKDNYGLHVPFFGFTICCVLGLIFIIFFVPETKGKTLEEIQQELRGFNSTVVETPVVAVVVSSKELPEKYSKIEEA